MTRILLMFMAAASAALAQPGGPPPREHRATQSPGETNLVPADREPEETGRASVSVEGGWRVIRANGIPDHPTGRFPNPGNPHQIAAQDFVFRVPAEPRLAGAATALGLGKFGVAVNGVPFDPGAAEWYRGERGGPWRYEALSGAVPLGLDAAMAHVQPDGAYHYHGLPRLLLKRLGLSEGRHSPLVGWAADGFPVYARFGYAAGAGNPARELRSSYRLKAGGRPEGEGDPGGKYDGTFNADYEYAAGTGDLDECNGRDGPTPDFPGGTYAYFLTEAFPVIPRCFKGTPSDDFRPAPPGGRRGERRRPLRRHPHPPPR